MSIIDGIFEAGVVGCGGAGFPTHIKFSGKGIQHLILNGAECEPLLRTDRYIMKNKAKELIDAAEAIRLAIGAKDCTIALKRSYVKEIEALDRAISEAGVSVTLHLMDSFYPAGDEHVVVYEVLGTPVPPMGIPLDVGAVVSNVATVLAVKDALEGIPFTQKYVTVTGRVKQPVILRVPVGTSFESCIRLAGGALDEDYVVISGGPMMGVPLSKEESQSAVVTKTTSGIILVSLFSYLATHSKISLQHMKNRAAAACIQCNFCTQLCPRYLLGHPLEPHRIMRKMAAGGDFADMLEDPDIQSAALCCECGVCETYACPMELQPRRINALIKQELAKAGMRYQPQKGENLADSNRDYRKVPTKRMAARAGVLQYYDCDIDTFIEGIPDKVHILLKQHAGLPAQPLVAEGQRVAQGQMIGACPNDKMGANIHASIDGVVTAVNESGITIERRE
jgi:Na+-translocating ferredoxin:NAD+ oxidoreductase RnfC subunit